MSSIIFQETYVTDPTYTPSEEEVKIPNLSHPSKKFEEMASIPNQGLLHAFLAKCLRPNIAIFLFIFINFVLNTSDAGSDLVPTWLLASFSMTGE